MNKLKYQEAMEIIDFLNKRMRPLNWHQWRGVTWEKCFKWYEMLNKKGDVQDKTETVSKAHRYSD